jgi:hypothetical protein
MNDSTMEVWKSQRRQTRRELIVYLTLVFLSSFQLMLYVIHAAIFGFNI